MEDGAFQDGSPMAPGEDIENNLTRFINNRDKERRRTEGDRSREVLWADSARAYAKKREHERIIEELRN
jgi:hypothetical protein